jgi:hypothetical protein
MPWAPDYVSLSTLKAVLRITDTDDDVALQLALSGACRSIDEHCGRQFGAESTAVARFYSAAYDLDRGRYVVAIDDLATVTDLAVAVADTEGTYDRALTVDTDYTLQPRNAAADARPWTLLVGNSGTTLPAGEGAIRVTARWGWAAVPDMIEQATLIQATRLFRRKDSPFGVAGSPETGSELRLLARLDPDVALLVAPLRRVWGAV